MSGNVVAALPLEMPKGLNKAKLVLWYQMLSATFEYEWVQHTSRRRTSWSPRSQRKFRGSDERDKCLAYCLIEGST